MFRPQIQKTSTLFFIALFNVCMVYIAVNSQTKIEKVGYQDKIHASNKMEKMILELDENFEFEKSELDIYNTGLFGTDNSSITTIQDYDSLMVRSKLLTTHPSFAAIIVEFFYDAEIEHGDTIAVSMTGSFPGANIALLSACEAMGVIPISISSAGSSSWGANREVFSWPTIESFLYDKKLIKRKSIGYSMGGDNDNGDNLPDSGIELLESIIPDNVVFVNRLNLFDNIDEKIELFRKSCTDYSMYVNIGGGASSLGPGNDKDTLQVGLLNVLDMEDLEFDGFESSIAYQFLKTESIPMLNIKNITKLVSDSYKKEFFKGDMQIDKGSLFYKYDSYNQIVILLFLFLSVALITSIGVFSHLQIKRRMETHEVDSII